MAQLRAPKVVLTVIYKKYHQRIFGSCQSNLQFLSTDFEDLVDKIFQKSLQLKTTEKLYTLFAIDLYIEK